MQDTHGSNPTKYYIQSICILGYVWLSKESVKRERGERGFEKREVDEK